MIKPYPIGRQDFKAIIEDGYAYVDKIERMYEMVRNSPFEQYEVSNFAVKSFESRHNSSYWHRVPYLGLGPAAHSYDGKHRSWNAPTLSDYFYHQLLLSYGVELFKYLHSIGNL